MRNRISGTNLILYNKQWENIPKATRHDECACAYDTCEEVTDELNILPIHKTNDVDPCFETFFPIFFSLHDDPIQQKLYFEKSFVRENVCDVGNPTRSLFADLLLIVHYRSKNAYYHVAPRHKYQSAWVGRQRSPGYRQRWRRSTRHRLFTGMVCTKLLQ